MKSPLFSYRSQKHETKQKHFEEQQEFLTSLRIADIHHIITLVCGEEVIGVSHEINNNDNIDPFQMPEPSLLYHYQPRCNSGIRIQIRSGKMWIGASLMERWNVIGHQFASKVASPSA